MPIFQKLRGFKQKSRFLQAWFVPVWLMLGASKVLVSKLPFQNLAPRLGRQAGVAPWLPLLNDEQERRARQISQVVRLTAGYTPWDSNCFPQAIAARLLLGFYGIPYIFFFGLARNPDKSGGMDAHAWVAAGRVPITGGYSFGKYTVVGVFAAPDLMANMPAVNFGGQTERQP